MRSLKILTLAAVLLAAALAVNRGSTRAAAPPPANAPPTPEELLKQLQSAEAAQRGDAQKQMANIRSVLNNQQILEQLAGATMDSELKGFFETRINQLKAAEEVRRITHLPGVSVALKTASLTEAIDALNRQLDAGRLQYAPDMNGSGNYTLDVKDRPFWEVVTALQKQQPFALYAGPDAGINVAGGASTNSAGEHGYAIDGPAVAYISNLTMTRSMDVRANSSRSELTIGLVIIPDPRLHVSRMKAPAISGAVDDQQRTIAFPTSATGYVPANTSFVSPTIRSSGTGPANSKSMSFVCDSTLEIDTATTVTTLGDLQQNVGKTIATSDRTIRLNTFNVPAPGGTAIISLTTVNNEVTGAPNTVAPANFTLLDANDKAIRVFAMTSTTYSTSFSLADATPPYKLQYRGATRSVQIPLHFQFKDIPLP